MGYLKMRFLQLLGATALLGAVGGGAIALVPWVALAQNQSDVTGPNLSDVTGPNLSDVTGPNLSENTAVLGGRVTAGGVSSGASDAIKAFFDEFGDELGIDLDDSLEDQLRQAAQNCSERSGTGRRFSREPEVDTSGATACDDLGRLLQIIQDELVQQSNFQPAAGATDDQRIW